MTDHPLLLEAELLRADPSRLCKRGYFAANKAGEQIGVNSPDAVCWCTLGFGIKHAFNSAFIVRAFDRLYPGEESIIYWSDGKASASDVADLLTLAVQLQQERHS